MILSKHFDPFVLFVVLAVVLGVAYLGTDGQYGYAKANLTPVVVKPLSDKIPFDVYSSLMGLLASSGGKLVNGPNWY